MEEEEDGGTYFVDQDGQYYYQATPDSEPVLTNAVTALLNADDVTLAEDQTHMVEEDDDGYKTVAVVDEPKVNDVSYVLIVQSNDKTKEEPLGEGNMTIYDFNECEESQDPELSEPEDDKTKIVKIPIKPKKKGSRERHMCMYCNYTSPRKYLLSRHMKSHSEERPFKCNICEKTFKTMSALTNHVNTHTGTKPFVCKHCLNAFTTSGELVRHVRYKHTHEKPHKCTECDYASVELTKLKRHIRCHTGERPYQCQHCTYASPDTFKLKRHLRIHTGEKPYKCDECQDAFSQSNSLKAHKLIHNIAAKPVFKCDWCPVTCGRKTDLRIHVQKLHTADKPLKCRRCGKSFPDRYSYKVHSKTHEGERCFKCDLCPYAATSQRGLDTHRLIHTNEKPFACEQCDQAFRQKQLLKRHQNLYHNPDYVRQPPRQKHHECCECGRQFHHKGNLIRHMELHDPESGIHEKVLALRMGRQKKIVPTVQKQEQPTDNEEDDEDPKEDALEEAEVMTNEGQEVEMVAVQGADGRQYVVLEVIQLHNDETAKQQVTVVSTDDYLELDEDAQINTADAVRMNANDPKAIKMEGDVSDFFGFDDEDDLTAEPPSQITHVKIDPSFK